MKTRYSIFILMAAAALAGCTKEQDSFDATAAGSIDSEATTLEVGIDIDTKTYLGEKDGEGHHKVFWSNGDQIAVNGTASEALAGLADDTSSAKFTFGSVLSAPYSVVYPASAWKSASQITLPGVQTWKSGGFADGMNPMAGYSADGSGPVSVKHLGAIIKVSILRAATAADEDNILSVRFKGRNSEQVKGDFNIDFSTGVLTGASDAAEDKEVRVNKSLATSTSEAVVYHLVVPAGTYASGFDVTIQDVNGHIQTKSVTVSTTLEAGHLYNLPEFEFVPTGTELGVVISSAQELIDFATAYNNGKYEALGSSLIATVTADLSFDATSSAAFNATGGIGTKEGVGSGTADNYFDGTFNGGNHTISGLEATVPLFVATQRSASIKDLTIDNSCSFIFTHPGSGNFEVGSVVGYHRGVLDNVSVAADVSLAEVADITSITALGGLVGRVVVGSIENGCVYSGLISTPAGFTSTGYVRIGGLAGEITNEEGSISGSFFKGAISNAAQVTSTDKTNPYLIIGGIVGYLPAGEVSSCESTADHADVESAYSGFVAKIVNKTEVAYHSAVGGIVGESVQGTISDCTNAAAIGCSIFKGSDPTGRYMRTGGIVGKNGAESTVTGCVNNATVQHRSNPRLQSIGGIAGWNAGTINACTNNAAVNHMTSGQSIKAGRVVSLGGVIGENSAAAVVSDVHNTANIEISSMEDGTNSDVRMGGVFGLNQANVDGGVSKNITNSGRVYFSPNMTKQFLGYEIGGIAGQSEASVKNAKNTGYVYLRWNSDANVASKVYMGGIVGKMAGDGTIAGCVNEGGSSNAGEVYPNVKAGNAGHNNIFAGGILGYSESNVIISDCTNSGYVHGGNGTRVAGTSFYTGGIVAYLKGASSILDCANTGQVNNAHNNNTDTIGSTPLNGGIAGYVEGTDTDPIVIGGTSGCSVDASIVSTRGWVAGIAGYAKYVNLSNCTVEQDISVAARGIGGIIGKAEYCNISSSKFNGDKLQANNTQVANGQGGIAGYLANSTIDGCYCYATQFLNNVSLTEQVGAIAGVSTADNTISNCHYKATIEVPTAGTSVSATVVGPAGDFTDGGGNAADL